MQDHIADPQSYGIYINDRRFKSANESIDQLAKVSLLGNFQKNTELMFTTKITFLEIKYKI